MIIATPDGETQIVASQKHDPPPTILDDTTLSSGSQGLSLAGHTEEMTLVLIEDLSLGSCQISSIAIRPLYLGKDGRSDSHPRTSGDSSYLLHHLSLPRER